MSDHAKRDHAILSASGSGQWMACPPSIRLTENIPDKETEFSKEGTLAHEIAECSLRTNPALRPKGDEWLKWHEKQIKIGQSMDDKTYNDMLHNIWEYTGMIDAKIMAAKIKDKGATLVIEKRLDLSRWVPESFGTADAIIITNGTLEVIDLKYGKGIEVSAIGNSQMRLYGLGALDAYSDLYDITHVRMTISQPRITDLVSSEILTVEELLDWGEKVVKPAAALAWEGKGEFKSGSHCRFCKAGAQCRVRAEENLALAQKEFKSPHLLSDQEVGEVLKKAQEIQAWVNAVETWIFNEVKDGRKVIPGWKLVEGTSRRKITDPEKLTGLLIGAGYTEDEILKTSLCGIGDLEKVVGKKKFKEIAGDYVQKPPGAPTLAPEEDPRKPWRSAEADFDDIPEVQSSLLD